MAEQDPSGITWDFVASEVVERLRPFASGSPTLIAAINFGVRYVKIETDSILFDARALTLGLLAAGTPGPTAISYHNAAFWFRSWLQERIGAALVDEALASRQTPFEAVEEARGQNRDVALSVSVRDLAERAVKIAQATVSRAAFDVRHLFAAMVEKGTVAEQAKQLFDASMTVDDIRGLKLFLVAEVMKDPEAGETRESWEAVLGLAGVTPSPPPPPGPREQEIIRFSHDGSGGGGNVLETKRDVEALAKLVCLKGSTPLAVAIFGGWGSGKTTFMDALDDKIEEIAGAEASRTGDGAASPFVTRVVQIKFNAWQFVDANLWASLTAEFFDQLRAGGWRRAGTARHAGLVEKVNSHVHSLSAEAAAHRAAVVRGNQHVLEAQEARDAAARAVREAKAGAMSQAAMDTLGEIYEGQKDNLRALGVAVGGQDPAQGVDAMIAAVRSSRSVARQLWTVLQMVWKYRAAAAALGAALLLAAAAGLWLVWSGPLQDEVSAAVATMIVALGSFTAFWQAAAPAVRFVSGVARRGADLAQTLEAADEGAVKELIGKEAALRDATAEAEARVRVADRAERALARYVDPAGPSNPPRLLRYVLEDDPETKAFEKEIGLIGRARRLFQAVNDIIVKDDGDAPQRIILYIDDLDRCTEEQVYNVLQAIHLLLAFESFAVVVGVDVKWIEGALAAEFAADRLPPLSEIERRQHAVHYLEKIFQVAFWLDPLSSSGKDGGSFAAFVKSLTKPEEAAAPSPPPPVPDPASSPAPDGGMAQGSGETMAASAEAAAPAASAERPAGLAGLLTRMRRWFAGDDEVAETPPAASGGEDEASAVEEPVPAETDAAAEIAAREAFRTVEIEQVEIDFLASPEIAALAGTTPRSVKRLVNVYRLVRSRLADDGISLLGSDAAAPAYPLVALATAVETGQPVEVAAALTAALRAVPPDTEIVGLDPRQEGPQFQLDGPFQMALAGPLRLNGEDGSPVSSTAVLAAKCPGLLPALSRVHELRSGRVAAREMLKVARLARRFSFNRYH